MPEEEMDLQEEEEPKELTAEEMETAKQKKKKVVRRRKTRKEKENPVTSAIRLTVESGKVEFGTRRGVSASLHGKAKLFVIAGNTPADIRKRVSDAAKKAEIPVLEFSGNTMELGSVCGKPFPVSVLSVFDAGTSSIMKLAGKG